jgi:4-diphosphocytidyl-2-C-methyl-D-erythritol kinase
MVRTRRPRRELVVRAPAKVNLYLELLRKRPDGYHDIRTVMQAVSLYDELTLRPAPRGRLLLECVGGQLPTGDTNLVLRAARLMEARCAPDAGADIRLVKGIPVGGGLGGGSSDAALTLLALKHLWNLHVEPADLEAWAAELGSDVPFFLRGGTALCEGRGERIMPIACPRPIHYVLVMPGWPVPTAGVYAAARPLTDRASDSNNTLRALGDGDAGRLASALRNDLQEAALRLNPPLQTVWEQLLGCAASCGIEGVALSGSGASFLGVARGALEARQAVGRLASKLNIPCAAVMSLPSWSCDLSGLTGRRRRR